MKPFRKNMAIAIDGGGIRGVIVARALAILEDQLGQPLRDIVGLVAGTSTGSVIAAGICAGLSASKMYDLYIKLGKSIFKKTWRSKLWPLTRYRYETTPLKNAFHQEVGDLKLGEFWNANPRIDAVFTTFDLLENRTRFIKPWKAEYQAWPVIKAVLASCAVPTYFPVLDGRFVDGGVGAYANPCYLAAYELSFCLGWDASETTLISLGTGRSPHYFNPQQANSLWAWQWLEPMLGAFMQSADDQQIHLVNTFFQKLDFRRFQVNLHQGIQLDDVNHMDQLTAYGDQLGLKILNDEIDYIQHFMHPRALTR